MFTVDDDDYTALRTPLFDVHLYYVSEQNKHSKMSDKETRRAELEKKKLKLQQLKEEKERRNREKQLGQSENKENKDKKELEDVNDILLSVGLDPSLSNNISILIIFSLIIVI